MRSRITHFTLIFSAVSMILLASAGASSQDLQLAYGDGLVRAIPGENPHAFIGTWIVQLQISNCMGTIIDNHGKLLAVNAGGTTVETSGSTPFRSASMGVWQHVQLRDFVYAQQFFRFNPDGSRAGGVRAKWTVLMGDDGESYTATGDIKLTALNGTVVGTLCGAETGTRMLIPQ